MPRGAGTGRGDDVYKVDFFVCSLRVVIVAVDTQSGLLPF